MKASNFKETPTPKVRKKWQYKDGTRCRMTTKVMYSENRANKLADKLSPDERGMWNAYKCEYGKSHWHIGHGNQLKATKERT